MLSACHTFGDGGGVQVRNGAEYGTVEGRFRGRWWNYYERGRSYAEGEYWEEAEKDLRTALGGRSTDGLWPRTYGLHFIPEYFPHRELGIVLLARGDVDGAAAELEKSLSQKVSARAAYYLDEARRQIVGRDGLDSQPPVIEVSSPAEGEVTGALRVRISGAVSDDSFVGRVTVNGAPVPMAGSSARVAFEREVETRPGQSEILLVAEDLAGRRTERRVVLRSDVDGPAVSFDGPVVLPGVVSGVVYDPSGVEELHVGGVSAALQAGGGGPVAFRVELKGDELSPPVQYSSKDGLGNVTSGALPVDAVVLSSLRPLAVPAAAGRAPFSLAGGLRGMVVGGRVVVLAAQTDGAGGAPTIRLANLAEGDTYLMDEIVVGLEVDAAGPLAKAQLNGADLPLIPGRTGQRFSRRVALQEGENRVQALAEDASGTVATAQVTVKRELTEVENPKKSRLSMTLLGNVWKGNSPKLENEADYVLAALDAALASHNRFLMVDRNTLPQALTEQELSAALGDKDNRLALGKVIPAEIMLVGQVRRDAQSMEIIAQAVNTETSAIVARADVAGPADSVEELDRLVRDLSLRIVQEFPRVQGLVAAVDGEGITTTLGRAQRVRESLKCVVFRYGPEIKNPQTGQVLGRQTTPLAEALVDSVDDLMSTAGIIIPEGGTPPQPVEVGDYVVTK